MPRRPKGQIPEHRRHRASGRGYVTIDGVQTYTGKWGEPGADRDGPPSGEAEEAYNAIVARWFAAGRRLPAEVRARGRRGATEPDARPAAGITVGELAARYKAHAAEFYRKDHGDGRGPVETTQGRHARNVLDAAARMFGGRPASEFGIEEFEQVRRHWIGRGLCRRTVNQYAAILARAFRWAAGRKLLPSSVWHDLKAVEPIGKGRTEAPERPKIAPAPADRLDAAVGGLSHPTIRDMIRLQQCTGMRPGEVRLMRLSEVDAEPDLSHLGVGPGEVWLYSPAAHKTSHAGESRTIALGRRAQAILRPHLDDAAARMATLAGGGRAPRFRRCRPMKPGREPDWRLDYVFLNGAGNVFGGEYYAKMLRLARRRAGVEERITPNSVRKTRAGEVRRSHGIEAAQSTLGHRNRETTERFYCETPIEEAIRAARESG